MTKFTKELINDYADKLLIGLTDEENKIVLDEFEIIEANMNKILEIKGIENVEPMHFPFKENSTIRSGEECCNEEIYNLLKNSDKVSDREIEVPRVVG